MDEVNPILLYFLVPVFLFVVALLISAAIQLVSHELWERRLAERTAAEDAAEAAHVASLRRQAARNAGVHTNE